MSLSILIPIFLFLGLSKAEAQVATQGNKLGFTEVGQALNIASPPTAAYNIYVDGSTTATPATNITCAAGTPTTNTDCSINFPALTIGNHVVTLTQLFGSTESTKSTPFSFTFVVVVTPSGLKIVLLEFIPISLG